MSGRIVKLEFRPDHAEEFERAWLMLADLYIHSGKYDLAQDLCKRCLTHNQSCGKAWEYLGLVMEKEQSYKDAADAYERAWQYESERSAAVVRTAFCLATSLPPSARACTTAAAPALRQQSHTEERQMSLTCSLACLRAGFQAGLQLPEGQAVRRCNRHLPSGARNRPDLPKDQKGHP